MRPSHGPSDGRSDGPIDGRTVLHVDMDAFFASVEVLDRPELRGRPVVVGGTGDRGVVASCSYEARAQGVRSAMPSLQARARCPEGVFLPPRMARYREVSDRFRSLLSEVTPLVEPIGLDEAFLDVTGALRLLGRAESIGDRIRGQVRDQLGLSCSVGVGASKLVAKLASCDAKPRTDPRGVVEGPGVVVVAAGSERRFLEPRPVGDLWGVGPATVARLHKIGVRTVGDVAALPADLLVGHLGRSAGRRLADLAVGIDQRAVVPDAPARSVGHEETFAVDLYDVDVLAARVEAMAETVGRSLRARLLAGRTVTVKVRLEDFTTLTRSRTVGGPLDAGPAIAALGRELLATVVEDGQRVGLGIRLLGVSVSGFAGPRVAEQLTFELGAPGSSTDAVQVLQGSWAEVSKAADRVRARFGAASVCAGAGGSLRGPPGDAG